MDAVFADFAEAYRLPDGNLLAQTLSPNVPASDPARLYNFRRASNPASIQTDLRYKLQYNPKLELTREEASAWLDIFTAYYHFVGLLLAAEELQTAGRNYEAEWIDVYEGWKEVVSALHKGYSNGVFEAWTIPCFYVAAKYLRVFAVKADYKAAGQRDSGLAFGGLQEDDTFDVGSKNHTLEDAARQVNRLFSLCIGDRNPLPQSRKWALYYLATLVFKIYFRLNSIALCKNILRSIHASSADMPPLTAFPKAHQVTFKYYAGVIAFLDEDYSTADGYLSEAYDMCDAKCERNIGLILTYWIPTKMLTAHRLPTTQLLQQAPGLHQLFHPGCSAIAKADLTAFNAAMAAGEEEFVKRRIYLTLERGRDILLRNIFRKVFLAGGYDVPKEGETPARRTRVPVKEFAAALVMAGAEIGDGEGGVDMDEVECLIANCIYKNFMKGYISRERSMVVLSKAGAFPGTGV